MRLIDVSDWRIGNATWRKRRWFDESQIGKLSDSTDLWLWRNSNTSLIGATIDSFRFQIGFNEIKCNRGEFYLEEVLWWSTLSDDWPTATLSHRYARDQYHVIHNTQQHSTFDPESRNARVRWPYRPWDIPSENRNYTKYARIKTNSTLIGEWTFRNG